MQIHFETITLLALDHVHGGQDAGTKESAEHADGNIGVTVPINGSNVQVGLQGDYSKSNYAKCVDAVAGLPNATPADLRAACGLPGGQP